MTQARMRILYVGTGDEGTCRARRRALQHFGHDVTVLNPKDYLKDLNRLTMNLYYRFLTGPRTVRFNEDLLRLTKEKAFDWIWVDKGTFVFPRTVKRLRGKGLFVIHHCTDDFMNPNQRMHFRYYKKALRDYHVHLTSNACNIAELKSMGVEFPVQTYLGFDHEWLHCDGQRPRSVARLSSDVAFVGHWRKHLDDFLMPLMEAGVNLRIWGPYWNRSPCRAHYRGHAAFVRATDEEYPNILASTRIGLCFLSRANRNSSTGRSFEIPAVGTFMLGERTAEHLSFYEEGIEAEFFDSPAELLQKVRHYLLHDAARERIAQAGHGRAMTAGYSYRERIASDLTNLRPIYNRFKLAGDNP